MAIPGFQEFMLPLLKKLGDGQVHKIANLTEELADDFNLSDEERAITLKSGPMKLYKNRIGWAKTYMTKAGIIQSIGHGVCKITNQGVKVLKKQPNEITISFLRQFPSFIEWSKPSKNEAGTERNSKIISDDTRTPEEVLERVHSDLTAKFEEELLEKVKSCSPAFFEHLVVELLIKMGYGGSREEAGKVLGGPGDGGIDGVINEDRLGLDIICIQAKRWENKVPPTTLHAFAGSLDAHGAKKGVIITTSSYSQKAIDFVEKIEKRIVMIDGAKLAKLMVEFDIGVTPVAQYPVYRVDSDFFEEE